MFDIVEEADIVDRRNIMYLPRRDSQDGYSLSAQFNKPPLPT